MSTTHTPETNRLTREGKRPFLLTGEGWPYLLVPLIPVAIFLELIHAGRFGSSSRLLRALFRPQR